jgi:hypothetical protein
MTKRNIIIAVVIAAVVAAIAVKLYRVGERQYQAELLWKTDEAYLLVGTEYVGYRATPATLLPELLMLMPFGGVSGSNFRRTLLVFKITREGVERHVADGGPSGPFGVTDDRITNGAWVWQGDHFEKRATELTALSPYTGREYSDADGWSKRTLNSGTSPPEGWPVAFTLSGQPVSLTPRGLDRVWQAIDLQRGSTPPERLHFVDERQRWVSRAEYESIFKR